MSEEAKLKQLNDHDLLIQISTKLTGLCIQFHDVKKENREDHAKIWNSFDEKIDKKLPARFFFWLMPFIILGILGVAGLASNTHYNSGKTEKSLEIHLKETAPIVEAEKETVKDAVTQSIIVQE